LPLKRIQALVLGLTILVIGGILLVIAQGWKYNVDKKSEVVENLRTISCYIEEGQFVVTRIYQNMNWTDPEGEGKYYDYGEGDVPQLFAVLNITNQQGNSTSFIITYRLQGASLTLYNIELYDNNKALNATALFDQNGNYLYLGLEGIACGEALTSGNYTFRLIGPGTIGGGERKSPPSRMEVWTGTVEKVYPYLLYLMPTGITLIVVGLGIPIMTILKENRKGVASKRRANLPRKPINNKS